jgi:hypothetical protein
MRFFNVYIPDADLLQIIQGCCYRCNHRANKIPLLSLLCCALGRFEKVDY